MKPIRIVIENNEEYLLTIEEIKYTFRTILTLAGFPWHFVSQYESESIDIYFGRTSSTRARLFIEMSNLKRKIVTTPRGCIEREDLVLLLFEKNHKDKNLLIEEQGRITHIFNDIIFSTFYLLTGWQEKYLSRDSKDRHNIQDSFLYQFSLLHTPIINRYALFIRKVFQNNNKFIPTWPRNKKFAVALSHDVDYPEMIRWIETLRYIFKYKQKSKLNKIIDILKGRESFWKFEDWTRLEQGYDFKSTYYFCGYQGTLFQYLFKTPDPFYNVQANHFSQLMQRLDSEGFEISMHASYSAYRSVDQIRAEKLIIEKALGHLIYGNRHHYWHMNPDKPWETAFFHHRVGLLYDSSLSFEKHSGFRNGISSPFHLFDQDVIDDMPILQLPPSLMDDHLFGHAKFSHFTNYQNHVDSLLDSIIKCEGALIVDYHVRVLNSIFYPHWAESYEYILKKVTREGNYYSDTLLGIAKYWISREHRIRAKSKDELSYVK